MSTPTSSNSEIPWRWFDRHSTFFVQRMCILAIWLTSSIAAVAWGSGGGEDNDLQARIMVVDTGFGIAVSVHNESPNIWKNVRLQLEPGAYLFRKPAFRPNERFSVQVRNFEANSPEGTQHPEKNFHPQMVRVVTDDGVYKKRF